MELNQPEPPNIEASEWEEEREIIVPRRSGRKRKLLHHWVIKNIGILFITACVPAFMPISEQDEGFKSVKLA